MLALALAGCAAVAGLAVVLWVATPQPELVIAGVERTPSGAAVSPAEPSPPRANPLVVDVAGGVAAPGLYALPAGSRVGDAISAAGGYSVAADLDAAAQRLNLAAPVSDGEKIIVPRLGETIPPPASGAGSRPGQTGNASGAGLIDINTADQALLETLPAVGPVTAAKIIAARSEAPFSSLDELMSRGVVGTATFEKIRPLVTVGP